MLTFAIRFRMAKPKKIIITGGPSTGKTTLIKELEKRGFACSHEVIRSLTAQEDFKDKPKGANPIVLVKDALAFNKQILDARVQAFYQAENVEAAQVFFDRGIPDILAYMDCYDQEYDDTFTKPCLNLRYDAIFLMPPWREIFTNDAERFESYEESETIYKYLLHTYRAYNYQPLIVPKTTVDRRIDFILNHQNEFYP